MWWRKQWFNNQDVDVIISVGEEWIQGLVIHYRYVLYASKLVFAFIVAVETDE